MTVQLNNNLLEIIAKTSVIIAFKEINFLKNASRNLYIWSHYFLILYFYYKIFYLKKLFFYPVQGTCSTSLVFITKDSSLELEFCSHSISTILFQNHSTINSTFIFYSFILLIIVIVIYIKFVAKKWRKKWMLKFNVFNKIQVFLLVC